MAPDITHLGDNDNGLGGMVGIIRDLGNSGPASDVAPSSLEERRRTIERHLWLSLLSSKNTRTTSAIHSM